MAIFFQLRRISWNREKNSNELYQFEIILWSINSQILVHSLTHYFACIVFYSSIAATGSKVIGSDFVAIKWIKEPNFFGFSPAVINSTIWEKKSQWDKYDFNTLQIDWLANCNLKSFIQFQKKKNQQFGMANYQIDRCVIMVNSSILPGGPLGQLFEWIPISLPSSAALANGWNNVCLSVHHSSPRLESSNPINTAWPACLIYWILLFLQVL